MVSRLGTKNESVYQVPTKNNQIKLVSCSSMIPLKRIHLIIEALSELRIPFHWYHIGDGPLNTTLRELASHKLAQNTFTFLGQMNNSQVLDVYKNEQIDLLINVSSTEGIPVSMMEALSFGIPCIGTNVGGVSEIIKENTSGYLLSANPAAQEVVGRLECHYRLSFEEKNKLSKKAYSFWDSNYNSNTNFPIFIAKLKAL